MNTPKISIIVPVYRVEKYLHRCLDSIVNQTFTDWECLLVDDGSPDNSGKICDEYSEKDGRFKVFHQENAGVSAARNKGLDEAKGEWIGFVDSDDWIDKKTYEVVYNRAVKENVDLIQWGYVMENINTEKQKFIRFQEKEFSSNDASIYWNPSMWIKLVSRKLIYDNNLRYPIGVKLSEDRIFAVQCFINSTKSLALSDVFYHYCMNEDSVSHSMTREMVLQEINTINTIEVILRNNNCHLDDYILQQKIAVKSHAAKINPPNFDLCRNAFTEINQLFLRKGSKFSYVYIFIHLKLDWIAKLILQLKRSLSI